MYYYLVEYNEKVIGSYSDFISAKLFILSCLQNNFMKDFALIHQIMKNSCYRIKTKKISLESKIKEIKTKLNNRCQLSEFSCTNTFSNSDSEISSQLSYESDSEVISSNCTTSESNSKSSISDSTPKADSPNIVNTTKSFHIDYSNPVVLEMAKQRIDLQHKINLMKKQKEKIEESKNVYENDLKLFNIFKTSKETNPTFEIPELFIKKYNIMHNLEQNNQLSWENFTKNYQQENYYGDYFSSNSYENMFVNSVTESTEESDAITEEFNINTDSD